MAMENDDCLNDAIFVLIILVVSLHPYLTGLHFKPADQLEGTKLNF